MTVLQFSQQLLTYIGGYSILTSTNVSNVNLNNKYVLQYTNNTNKEHLVITLYHNKILHTIHKKFFLSPIFLQVKINHFRLRKQSRQPWGSHATKVLGQSIYIPTQLYIQIPPSDPTDPVNFTCVWNGHWNQPVGAM